MWSATPCAQPRLPVRVAGANALNGGGGADALVGLAGDDSYVVDRLDDRVIEPAGQGRRATGSPLSALRRPPVDD